MSDCRTLPDRRLFARPLPLFVLSLELPVIPTPANAERVTGLMKAKKHTQAQFKIIKKECDYIHY